MDACIAKTALKFAPCAKAIAVTAVKYAADAVRVRTVLISVHNAKRSALIAESFARNAETAKTASTFAPNV